MTKHKYQGNSFVDDSLLDKLPAGWEREAGAYRPECKLRKLDEAPVAHFLW